MKILKRWWAPAPDSGWLSLALELQGRAVEVRLGEWSASASLSATAAGHWGLAKMFPSPARFRDWGFDAQ